MSALPHMPFYIDDFEAATAHLTIEEDGAYNRLLRLCWRSPGCSIPNDPEWICRRVRCDRETYDRVVRPVIEEFFASDGNRVWQKRQLREWEKARDTVERMKTIGAKGGLAKALKTKGADHGIRLAGAAVATLDNQTQNQNHKKDPPTPQGGKRARSSKNETGKKAGPIAYTDEFEAFLAVYPRRAGKGRAFEVFQRFPPRVRRGIVEIAAPAFAAQMRAENRPEDKMPHAATWLNGAGYDDFIEWEPGDWDDGEEKGRSGNGEERANTRSGSDHSGNGGMGCLAGVEADEGADEPERARHSLDGHLREVGRPEHDVLGAEPLAAEPSGSSPGLAGWRH